MRVLVGENVLIIARQFRDTLVMAVSIANCVNFYYLLNAAAAITMLEHTEFLKKKAKETRQKTAADRELSHLRSQKIINATNRNLAQQRMSKLSNPRIAAEFLSLLLPISLSLLTH